MRSSHIYVLITCSENKIVSNITIKSIAECRKCEDQCCSWEFVDVLLAKKCSPFFFFVIRRFYIIFTRARPGIWPEAEEFSLYFRILLIIRLSQAIFYLQILRLTSSLQSLTFSRVVKKFSAFLKNITKIYIKIAPTCFDAVATPSSGSSLSVLAKVTLC
jgi:hypothetical protein